MVLDSRVLALLRLGCVCWAFLLGPKSVVVRPSCPLKVNCVALCLVVFPLCTKEYKGIWCAATHRRLQHISPVTQTPEAPSTPDMTLRSLHIFVSFSLVLTPPSHEKF